MSISIPQPDKLRHQLTEAIRDAMPRRAQATRLHVWRMATLPYWFGSDVPPPMLPSPHAIDDIDDRAIPAASWTRHTLRKLSRRFWVSWLVSAILRGAVIGALFALLWAVAAAVDLLDPPGMRGIVVVIALFAIPGLVLGLVNRPGSMRVATMLDRTFQLDERLVTALEPRANASDPLVTMQRADAANALASILKEIRLSSLLPVRELVLLMLALTSLVAVWVFTLESASVATVTNTNVPGYYPASERLADQERPLPQQPGREDNGQAVASPVAGSNEPAAPRQDLTPLSDALDGHETTQPAADSLEQGDAAGAASALDAAAPAIAGAAPEERNALADDLDAAADAMEATNPDLAQQARDSADAIRAGGQEAEQGVADLADAIEAQAPQPGANDPAASGSSSSNSSAPVGEQQPGGGQSSSSSAADEPGAAGAEPGDSGGSDSDPGSGSDAAPGTSDQAPADSGSAPGEQPGDQGGSANGSNGSDPGSGEGENGAGSENSDGQAPPGDSSGGGSASDTGALGQPNDESSTSQGSGAGGGQTDANDTPPDGQAPNTTPGQSGGAGDPDDTPPETEPGEAPVGETGNGGNAAGSGDNTLEIGGISDDATQSGNDIGSSSLGSGSAGSTVGSGDASSPPLGPAGPDSNHVPSEYEDVVSDYFSEPEP